jgi:hypothetical protein
LYHLWSKQSFGSLHISDCISIVFDCVKIIKNLQTCLLLVSLIMNVYYVCQHKITNRKHIHRCFEDYKHSLSNHYEITNFFLFYILYISKSLECHVHLKLNAGKPMVLRNIKHLVFKFTHLLCLLL